MSREHVEVLSFMRQEVLELAGPYPRGSDAFRALLSLEAAVARALRAVEDHRRAGTAFAGVSRLVPILGTVRADGAVRLHRPPPATAD